MAAKRTKAELVAYYEGRIEELEKQVKELKAKQVFAPSTITEQPYVQPYVPVQPTVIPIPIQPFPGPPIWYAKGGEAMIKIEDDQIYMRPSAHWWN